MQGVFVQRSCHTLTLFPQISEWINLIYMDLLALTSQVHKAIIMLQLSLN
jgi:hypothetical protein